MTSRKAEFLNIIKPILDRSQVDKDAENLAVELQDKLGKFKVGLDESGLKEFEEVFNKEMVALGKQPIVLSNISIGDNTIRDMAKQIARGVAGAVGNEISKGVKASVDDAMAEIARLEKSKKPYDEKKKELVGRKKILSSTIAAREDKSYIHPRRMAKEGDINEQAKKIYQEFQDAKNALSNLYEDVSVSDADYQKAEDRFYESVDNLYRMRQTIKNHMDEMTDKSIKKKFKFDNLNSAVDEAFSEVGLPSLDDSDSKLAEYEIKIEEIDKTLASIDSRIQEIKKNNKEIINEEATNKAIKSLEEVEAAYDRISKKTNKKEADSRKLNSINSAIDYDPAAKKNKNILDTLHKGLRSARESGAGWEEEYQWIVKFVKQYKYLQENGQLSAHLQKQYEPIFNELVGMAENAESSLRTLVDRAAGTIQVVDNKDKLVVEKELINISEQQTQAQNDVADATERELEATEEILKNTKLYQSIKKEYLEARDHQSDVMDGLTEGKESMRLLNSNGLISKVQGQGYSVDAKTMVGQLIDNLNSNIVMALHDHPNAMNAFTVDDLKSFSQLYYDQGIKINGVIADGIVRVVDFTGIAKETVEAVVKSFGDNVAMVAKETGIFSFDDKGIMKLAPEVEALQQSNPEEYNEILLKITQALNSSLDAAFRQHGLESTVKEFSNSQLPELAKYLLDIEQSGKNAVIPVEKLKNLIVSMNHNKSVEWGNYADILKQFEDGSIDGADAVGQILVKMQEQTAIHKENTKAIQQEVVVQEQLNKAKQEEQQVENTDNTSNEVAEINAETEAIEKKTEAVRNLQALVDSADGTHGQSLASAGGTPTGEATGTSTGIDTQELQKILTNTYKVQIVQKHDAPDSDKKAALIDIEALKQALGQVTYNTKIVTDDTDKTANKIALDDSTLETTLNRVFANILNPVTQQNDGQTQGSWALESTLQTVKGVLEKINNKIVQGTKVIKTGDKKTSEKKSDKPEIKKATDDGYVKATKVDTRVKELQGLYEKQGILEAQLKYDSEDAKVQELLKQNEEDILKLKKEGVTFDEQELANLKEKAKQRKADVLNAEKVNEARKQAVQDEKAELRARIKRDKEENRVNTSTSAWNSGNKALESLWKIDDKENPLELKSVKDLRVALQELNTVRQRVNDNLRKGIPISEADSNELRDKTEQVTIHTEAVKKLISNYTALSGANIKETGNIHDPNADLEAQLVNAVKTLPNVNARIGDFDAATGRLKYTVKTGAYTFQEYEMAVREAGGAIVSIQGATKRTETFLEGFKRKFSEITRYFSASSLIFKAVNEVRKGIQYIREIDSALTELKKVTDETEETYDKFLDTASKTAAKVGSTIKDVVSSTADWARLGYSMKEAAELAESTQILMNVSEFTNISDATDSLISSIQAFKYTAEESMDVVDILNTIGNNYAISTSDLAKSLTKSSGALVSANNTLEEAVALTAAANTIIQDADVVGTALKTASMRIRGTSVKEMEEEGLDTDGYKTQSKLRQEIKAISGVDILTDTGAYKSTYQILAEISKVWDDITDDKARAGLLELLAGKRSGSVIASILENPETLKNAFEDASNAAGSALAENEKYLDSIQGRIDLFNNAVQTMWSNTLDSDWVKMFVDFGTTLVKLIDDIGGVKIAFMGLGAYLTRGMDFTSFSKPAVESLDQMHGTLEKLKIEMDAASAKDLRLRTKKSAQKKNDTTQRYNDYAEKVKAVEKEEELNKLAKERLELEDELKKAEQDVKDIWEQGGSGDSDLGAEFDAASQKVDNLKKKIDENGMSIDDANNRTKNLGNTMDVTGKKGQRAFAKIGLGIKSALKVAKKFIAQMAAMYAITTVLELAGKGIEWIKEKIKKNSNSFEKTHDEFEELNNELSNTESELRSLESELDKTNDRVEELLRQDTLSLVEQDELSRLQSQTAELERQIELVKQLQGTQKISVNTASLNAANAYMGTSAYSDKTKSERQEKAEETGNTVGSILGMILGVVGGAVAAYFSAGTAAPIGYGAGMMVGSGIGSAIGGLFGGAAGSAIEGSAYDSEETVEEMLNRMAIETARLRDAKNAAYEAYTNNPSEVNKKAWQDASKVLGDYNAILATHINQLQQYVNAVDYSKLTDPDEKQAYLDALDYIDAYAIQQNAPNAKLNAITRLFGETASDDIKAVKADIEKAMKEAADSGTDPIFDFETVFNSDKMAEFKQRLYNMGLTVTDVKYYFLDLARAEKEAEDSYTTYDTVKQINSLSGGINALKDAFGEITEEGYVSAETLVELEETFGGLGDSWKNFVDTVATGTGSIKEATEVINELVEAYLMEKLASGPMGAEEELKTIMLLQQLGVKNAKEYIEAMQKASAMETIAKNIIKDDEEEAKLKAKIDDDTATDDDKNRYKELNSKSYEQYIKEVEELYQIDLTEDEERLLIEKAITAEKAKQDVITKKTQKNAYDTAVRTNEIKKDKRDQAQAVIDRVSAGDISGLDVQDNSRWYEYWTDKPGKGEKKKKYQESYVYNGKTYLRKQDLIDAIIADQQAIINDPQNADVELPIEVTEADVTNAEAIAESAKADLNTVFDELGLEVDVVLADPSDLVDQIQDVFDTLVDAQKEYEENGYLSVDTLQSLLKLEPKYLDLLVDESGNLNLTKDALYKVSIARINDMKLKQQDTILTDAEKLANEGSVDAMNAFVNAAYDSTEAYEVLINNRLASIRAALEERKANGDLAESFDIDAYINGIKNQLDAVDYVAQSTINNIENSLSSSGNTASGEVEDAFQKAMDYWDNRIEANQAKYDQIQNDIDWLESQGKMADANYYKDQIALMTEGEESKTAFLNNKLAQAAARMRELEAAGQEGSDEWWEAAGIYNDTLSELDDVRDTVIDLQDAIGEVEWSQFEEFNTRLDDINSKLETMRDLIAPDGEEDWFDDEGNWTEKGVAVLGSYIQSLEYYKNGLAEANKELEEFQSKEYNEANAKWFANTYGIHSEQEYYDYLQKLTDEQYNYATAVSDTEQDIVGMYESSIDAVEEYTSELIDSYNDYIDVVKEALDAERDLYNFKKDVKKQTKDIANLERRIASLSGSTNASDIAERRKLEAELYESRESLNDTYYEHSMDSQQEALDKEAQAYEESMNKFIEGLRANLDLALQDMDAFMVGVTAAVTANAPLILDEYGKLGISLDSAIVAPWQAAKDKMSDYTKEDGLGLMNSWTASGGVFDTFANNATTYLTSIWDDSNVDPNDAFATAINNKVQGIVTSIKSNVETAKGYLNDLANVADTSVGAPSIGGNGGGDGGGEPTKSSPAITALQKIINQFFGGALKEDGKAGPLTKLAIKVMQGIIGVKKTGEYDKTTYEALKKWLNVRPVGSWFREKGITIPAPMYASGTMGTKQSGFAVTDESWIGEEITLAAGKNGQLQYLKKGSAVMPADISANLVEWGKLNPNMLNVGGGANINMISNAVTKPEFNFEVENFLKVERVDKDTLPELEKLMDKKIDNLVRQLNYSLKKFK